MPIRILQVVNSMNRAGLETMLMNYYRKIDKNKVQFDFLTHRNFKGDYDDEILSLGGRIYHAPRLYPQNYIKYFKYMHNFFLSHPEYKIVHSHIDSMSYLPLLAAKRAGIPIRIAHSHNTSIDLDYKFPLKEFFRYKIVDVANEFCACGQEAGNYLFRGKRRFTYIPNAIEKSNFLYNLKKRQKTRERLQITNDEIVIGNVGRMEKQKNQKFLINVFNELHKNNRDTLLLIVGVGSKERELKKQVSSLNLNDSVRFLGNRDDVDELYQAMDVFVMPSLYEGIPVVGIEAQFSNLPCVFSNSISSEVKFNSGVKFESLNDGPKEWAHTIETIANHKISRSKVQFENDDFDVSKSFMKLQNYYLSLL